MVRTTWTQLRQWWDDRNRGNSTRALTLAVWAFPFPCITSILFYFTLLGNLAFPLRVLAALLTFVVLFSGMLVIMSGTAWAASRLVARSVLPSGDSSPYEAEYSYEQALVMQGRVDDAIASAEERIRAEPDNVRARIFAAELEAVNRSMSSAIAHFRSARLIEAITPEQKLHATSRLVDLYGKERNAEGVARELRYLAAHFPNSAAGRGARDMLAQQTAADNREEMPAI